MIALAVKVSPDNAKDVRDAGSISGSGRPPGGGHGNPLQYSCLKNPMDRGAGWATVHSVAAAAAATKWLQSCPTLCDPRDGSPPGSTVPGILQARTLEWVAISFSFIPTTTTQFKLLLCFVLNIFFQIFLGN